jgi:predicted cupin superfamily sugar epimerase
MTEADQIIAKLGLHPHPEGGWYRQTWVGPELHTGTDTRASGTAILFLLKAGEHSHWHRVDADEIWIWNAGAPLMLSLGETVARDIRMGPDVLGDDQAQAVVPAGHWQAARSLGDWSLVTCTVSPGFRFEGFELADPGFDLPRE